MFTFHQPHFTDSQRPTDRTSRAGLVYKPATSKCGFRCCEPRARSVIHEVLKLRKQSSAHVKSIRFAKLAKRINKWVNAWERLLCTANSSVEQFYASMRRPFCSTLASVEHVCSTLLCVELDLFHASMRRTLNVPHIHYGDGYTLLELNATLRQKFWQHGCLETMEVILRQNYSNTVYKQHPPSSAKTAYWSLRDNQITSTQTFCVRINHKFLTPV
jgi:hypothetical protein